MARRWAIVIGVGAAGVMALEAPPASATFPGPDGRIAFQAFIERTDSFEIFTATPDGGDAQQLTSNPRRMSSVPDWSPDGEMIAFDSDRAGGAFEAFQIYVMNADGSGLTQLTTGPGFHVTPGWSPDGSSLAISADWGDYPALQGIWIIPASDPGGVTQVEAQRVTTLPKGLEFDDEPQFSPDGSSIVFTRFKSERKSAIHRVNVDGTGLQRLTPWKLNASNPDWSPDGQMITFDSGDLGFPPAKPDIFVMGADGSSRTRLTDSRRIRKGKRVKFAQNPVWSPSGTKIMFTRFKARRFLPKSLPPFGGPLVVMNPDGSGKQVAVDGGIQNKVDWGTHP
jgi:Tol biopolymer transport system component